MASPAPAGGAPAATDASAAGLVLGPSPDPLLNDAHAVDESLRAAGREWEALAVVRLALEVRRLRGDLASRDANIQRMEREYAAGVKAWERQVEALYDAKHDAERERERYRRAVADLATRGHGVRRPKWLLATIAAAQPATPTPAAPGARGA